MAIYKEIVTKAVIGKGKKTFTNKYKLNTGNKIDTVLGCWVINHVLVISDNYCIYFFHHYFNKGNNSPKYDKTLDLSLFLYKINN